MRWYKTVDRILLICSVANVALAAPVVVRRGHLDVAGAASEKRVDPDDEATDGSVSEPMPELVSDSDMSGSGSSLEDWPPTSPPTSFHEGMGAYQGLPIYATNYWMGDGHSVSNHDSAPLLPSGPPSLNLAPESSSQHDLAPEAQPSHQDLTPDKFFSDALKQKIKVAVGVAVAVGVFAGLTYGLHKLIKGTGSPGNKTVGTQLGRDLASSVVVSRGGTSIHGHPDHPQSRKRLESRCLANLRGEDPRWLKFLTRRALESLD